MANYIYTQSHFRGLRSGWGQVRAGSRCRVGEGSVKVWPFGGNPRFFGGSGRVTSGIRAQRGLYRPLTIYVPRVRLEEGSGSGGVRSARDPGAKWEQGRYGSVKASGCEISRKSWSLQIVPVLFRAHTERLAIVEVILRSLIPWYYCSDALRQRQFAVAQRPYRRSMRQESSIFRYIDISQVRNVRYDTQHYTGE